MRRPLDVSAGRISGTRRQPLFPAPYPLAPSPEAKRSGPPSWTNGNGFRRGADDRQTGTVTVRLFPNPAKPGTAARRVRPERSDDRPCPDVRLGTSTETARRCTGTPVNWRRIVGFSRLDPGRRTNTLRMEPRPSWIDRTRNGRDRKTLSRTQYLPDRQTRCFQHGSFEYTV